MPISNPIFPEIRDEGISLGRTQSLNFTGAGVSASGTNPTVINIPGGGAGSFSLSSVEQDLGSLPLYSGTFDITGLAGLTLGNPVLVIQDAGPYTGKGTLEDEAEMDRLSLSGYVLSTTSIRVFWGVAPGNGPVKGNFVFNFAASA